MNHRFPPNARLVALDVLRDIHEKDAYASLALQNRLHAARLSVNDRRLVTSIVYTTLERQFEIDFALDELMAQPTAIPVLRDILRVSACQILFHQRIPDSAAVNEGVKLAKLVGQSSSSGFLNGVLRNLVRGKDTIPWPKREKDFQQYLHIMGNMPIWLAEKLIQVYGETKAEEIIMSKNIQHGIIVRPNSLKLSDEAFEKLLDKKSWEWKNGIVPHAYSIKGAVDIASDMSFKNGMFSIQGQSSMLAAEAVQAKPGMRILDACAAPGGKAAYMAEAMQDTGRLFAWDVHEHRVRLLQAMKKRLQLENLRITVRDAAQMKDDFESTLDAVLLDAPCTGLGVLSDKPDLKYRLKETDIPSLVQKQKTLLDTVARYVKPGGTLVYSTCSILPEENEDQIQDFLRSHPEYSVQPLPGSFPEELRKLQTKHGLQLLQHRDQVEGFFICKMKKQGA